MAPIPYRPPTTPLIQPSLIPPTVTPAKVTLFIPRKLFLQLLAGTVCIFILTVLIWKIPRFLRSFTKARILREGNTSSARYAKTWYGWVSFRRHEANKRVVQNCMATLRSWTAWGSSRADLESAWWDPERRGSDTYQKREKQRMLKWTRRYNLVDAMWDHMSPLIPSALTNSTIEATSSPFATGALSPPDAPRPTATLIRRPTSSNISLQEGFACRPSTEYSTVPRLRRAKISEGFGSDTSSHIVPHISKTPTSSPQLPFPESSSRVPLSVMHYTKSSPRSFSMPCLLQPKRFPIYPHLRASVTPKSRDVGSESFMPDISPAFRVSRRYQVWSARMGVQTLKCIGYDTHALPTGPPGSPKSAVLGSLSLDSTVFERARQYQQSPNRTSSHISDLIFCSGEQQYNTRRSMSVNERKSDVNTPREWHSLPLLRSHLTPFRRPTLVTWYEDSSSHQPAFAAKAKTQDNIQDNQIRKCSSTVRTPHFVIRANDWSNWEVRLIYELDRRLEWTSNQLTPGQRPFHFALLSNHWLNRETWVVYDPVSRVPADMRRRWGDPRFNVPYPAPTSTPTSKYPKSNRRPAHTPKINSWRLAVNRHRMASGLKLFIKRIELYDSSAEDPPDGKIDPASWVLRKPPQGFSLSARQREKYYEGGAGWQEKLSDWQRIRRGYRIRKAIYEGRVNRTRAKEIVYGIIRYYRKATSRFVHSDAIRRVGGCKELPSAEPS